MQTLSTCVLLTSLLAGAATAQCVSVTSLSAGGSAQNGTMFDIVNTSTSPVSIGSFDQCFNGSGTSNVYIYTKAGSWNGFETDAAAWTLVGGPVAVTHGNFPVIDPIPIAVNVGIPVGATQAFYITCDGATTVIYTTGTAQLNTVIASNADLQVLAGVGKVYPFATSFGLPTDGRLFNGRVHYCPVAGTEVATNTPLGTGCVAAYNSFYQYFGTSSVASAALTGNTLTLIPAGSGYQGTWSTGTAAADYVPPGAGATVLAVGNNDTVAYQLLSGNVPTPYGPQTSFRINGNGVVAFGAGPLAFLGPFSYVPTSPGFLNASPGGLYVWHDYNCTEGGFCKAEEVGGATGTLLITFEGAESYANPELANPSTMQFQLDKASGVVKLVFVSIDGNATSPYGSGYLVGVSAPGASNDPGSINLAMASPVQLLTVGVEILPLTLTASNRPIQQAAPAAWNLVTSNVPAGPAFGVDMVGLVDAGIADLSLLGLGQAGCQLRTNLDLVLGPWIATGANHNWSFTLPGGAPSVINAHLYVASAVFPLSGDLSQLITTNGIDGKIGDY